MAREMIGEMSRDEVFEALKKYDPKLREELRQYGEFYGIHVEMYAKYLKEKNEPNYKNYLDAARKLRKAGYSLDALSCTCARVYYKDKSGDFTALSTCDDIRPGMVTIEGKAQNIDEWLNRRSV